MRHPPFNRDDVFEAWRPFDPGRYLDMNPGFVRRGPDEAWSVFCRYDAPPRPGQASIWAVRVDRALRPCGVPVPILARGIDPRAIPHGDRVLVFFAVLDRDAEDRITGSAMAFAEFAVEGDRWTSVRALQLPKNPVTGPLRPDASSQWEKNWVPFPVGPDRVGLIYSHDPWTVITLAVGAREEPRLVDLHGGPSLVWDFGTIRGGTPPVRYDDDHLVTFFHSSQVAGGKTVYAAGACVFAAAAPYGPVLQTTEPLLVGPYASGVHRFGWAFAASVVFPLGAEPVEGGYRLLCGRDDGEVAVVPVPGDGLRERLQPPRPGVRGALHGYAGRGSATPVPGPLLYVPDPLAAAPDLPTLNFMRLLAGTGRTLVDADAGVGAFTVALAPGYARVESYAASPEEHRCLRVNAGLNDLAQVADRAGALGDGSDGSVALDAQHLTDVDLLRIDAGGGEEAALRGALDTINASRPLILLRLRPGAQERVEAALGALAYTAERLFPRAPDLAVFFPRERRADYAWFV